MTEEGVEAMYEYLDTGVVPTPPATTPAEAAAQAAAAAAPTGPVVRRI